MQGLDLGCMPASAFHPEGHRAVSECRVQCCALLYPTMHTCAQMRYRWRHSVNAMAALYLALVAGLGDFLAIPVSGILSM